MAFYVARLIYADGDWSEPWTTHASTLPEAIKKFDEAKSWIGASQSHVIERPETDASFYGHDTPETKDKTLRHPGVAWSHR